MSGYVYYMYLSEEQIMIDLKLKKFVFVRSCLLLKAQIVTCYAPQSCVTV